MHHGLVIATILRGSRRSNAFYLQRVAQMRRATDGAAFYAAPDSGSGQHRNGTKDVKTPPVAPRCGSRAVRGRSRPWFRASQPSNR